MLEERQETDGDQVVQAELVNPPANSIATYNIQHKIIERAKTLPKPKIVDTVSTDIVESSNEKEVLRKQISRINKEIRQLELEDRVDGYLLDLRRILAGYLKLWLDHEHRSRDLESQDLNELQQVLTGKLDRLSELAINWDCEHCSDKIQSAFLQVVSE